MDPQTIKIRRRSLGRPKTRDTETVTLNLDRKVLEYLREMSAKHGMPRNHIIEILILSAVNEEYPLQVKEENNMLKDRLKAYEERIKELEMEIERARKLCDGENEDIREIKELREKAHRILDRHDGKMKVFELVMRVFNLQPGERLQHMTKRFIEEYFVSRGSKELISKDLELVITKNQFGMMGWTIKKLQNSP